MNKKTLCGITALAMASAVTFNINSNVKKEVIPNISLGSIEAVAVCESIGWWDNDGNCVKNDEGIYFCKSDTWYELTDCLQ